MGCGCSENAPGIPVIVSNTEFINCENIPFGSHKCIGVSSSGCEIDNCRFQEVRPPELQTIYAPGNPVVLHENLFFNTGYALQASFAGTTDARWNWWGDSTGPYHAEFNPEGQGDEITGNVEFDPWYTDSLMSHDAADEQPAIPKGYSLSVFPNPFNSTTRLKLVAGDAAIISLELFDILGRRVRELWSGPVLGEHEISFSADNLPSGIYFARAMDVIYNRPLAKTKLVLLR
jgi:hypothetical protein